MAIFGRKSLLGPAALVAMHRMRTYSLTPEAFSAMVQAQGGLCAICKRRQDRFVVDHNHATGAVRGLLCYACNTGIGLLGDSPDQCLAAAQYLRSTSANEKLPRVQDESVGWGGFRIGAGRPKSVKVA